MNLPFEAEHGMDDAWVDVHEIDSSFHDVFTSIDQDESANALVTRGTGHSAENKSRAAPMISRHKAALRMQTDSQPPQLALSALNLHQSRVPIRRSVWRVLVEVNREP